ncbi:OLC1v1029715C1 [Oldenlandia corymbosa var. corymbosa]|uniref:OLC1v1029715C1 n=1 Tax=Oldenlandia corymbosa var. corymbosa TaxID=529605 RepID=A0AAV1CF83_OLDCO|nr:OLC1v1029715C1 [Oldenlandia corymbosa var. corymbosa]
MFFQALEDPVLLVPEEKNQKPYVAIIKDISQKGDGSMMVTGQWFYRPEEAEKKGGGNWESSDTRELFYSFHRDEVPAESVMHKCVVHFIPIHKQTPSRKQHPGFIVRRVYDTEQRRLFKLTDKDYEDNKQEEIDLLVQKTMSRLVDLPDIEPDNAAADQENLIRSKRLLRKKSMTPLDVSRDEEAPTRSGQSLKVETPGSTATNTSEYFTILSKFKALTGETQRDRWLEKLLQAIQFVCVSANDSQDDGQGGKGAPESGNESKKVDVPSISWPDRAVPAVTALEKASHEALSADFQKYNQKMRQLSFNLKNNAYLARRLLKGELDPLQISNMTPAELKEGLTAEEIARRKPEESERLQMTDARCRRCREKNVGVREIIQTGHGDRYQLECIACGNLWYASRDEVSTLSIDEASSAKTVGTVPSATAKFEEVEKKLISPRGGDKLEEDGPKKATEASVPVVDS